MIKNGKTALAVSIFLSLRNKKKSDSMSPVGSPESSGGEEMVPAGFEEVAMPCGTMEETDTQVSETLEMNHHDEAPNTFFCTTIIDNGSRRYLVEIQLTPAVRHI